MLVTLHFCAFVWILEKTATFFLHSIKKLDIITDVESVYCAVRTDTFRFSPRNYSPWSIPSGKGPETHSILNFVVGCLGTESIILTVLLKGIFCTPVRKSGNGFANACGDPDRLFTSLVNICILSFWHYAFAYHLN
jgi:hypothetical protein